MATAASYTRKRTASFSIHHKVVARIHFSSGGIFEPTKGCTTTNNHNLLGLSLPLPLVEPYEDTFASPRSSSSGLLPPPISIPSHQRIHKPAKHLHPALDDIIIVAPSDPLPHTNTATTTTPAHRPPCSPPRPPLPRHTSPLAPHPPRLLPPRPSFPRSKKSQNLYKQALQAQLATTPAGRKIRAVGAKLAISMIQADEEFERLMKKGRSRRWKDTCRDLIPDPPPLPPQQQQQQQQDQQEGQQEEEDSSSSGSDDGESDGQKTPEDALWSDVLGLGDSWEKEDLWKVDSLLLQPDDDPTRSQSALGLCF